MHLVAQLPDRWRALDNVANAAVKMSKIAFNLHSLYAEPFNKIKIHGTLIVYYNRLNKSG